LIACHDIPKTPYNGSDKIKFLKADFEPLLGQRKYMLDRIYKYKMIGMELKKQGADCFVMLMAADDLVSNKLVEYVNDDQDKYGYYIGKGYELDYLTRRLRPCPRYHRLVSL
jgi:hypothetical protein